MTDEPEYILGTEREELERLRIQHRAWIEQGYALFERAGLRAGHTVLDLGCGPGFTSFELARVVGPEGRVIARDESRPFLEFLSAEAARLGLDRIETSLGTVETLALAQASLDAAYARWLLCWLPDPDGVVALVARALRPDGVLVLQEYLDWAAMKLLPRSRIFDRAVKACVQSWREGGGQIDVGERAVELAAAAGLHVESLRPVARLGRVGSLEWHWIGGFFGNYLPKLVARGLFSSSELEAFRSEWCERSAEGTSYVYTPTMVDAVLRKD